MNTKRVMGQWREHIGYRSKGKHATGNNDKIQCGELNSVEVHLFGFIFKFAWRLCKGPELLHTKSILWKVGMIALLNLLHFCDLRKRDAKEKR